MYTRGLQMVSHCDIMTWAYFEHNCPSERGIHQLPMEAQNNGPVIQSLDGFIVDSLDKL